MISTENVRLAMRETGWTFDQMDSVWRTIILPMWRMEEDGLIAPGHTLACIKGWSK